MNYATVKVTPSSNSLISIKYLVFIFCVNGCGAGGSDTTFVTVDTNASIDTNDTVNTTLPETSTTYKITGSVAYTGNTTIEETAAPTPSVRPKAEEINEGENITAYCMRRMNCAQVCVRVSKSLHQKLPEDFNTTTIDLDLYKPGCVNDSTNMTCSHAHFLCVLDNCSCGDNTSSVSVCAQPVMVEPHIEMTSLRAIFVLRQKATYIIMESEGPPSVRHHCSWACATNVSNISVITEREGNLKSTFVCPTTGCTQYIHQSKHLANPMFNTSQLSECLVTCCASTDTNLDCLQINISNARHLSEFRPATINTLLVVLIGLGIATTAFVIVTLLVFYCCNNPVKRSIRKVKYRQYLRDRKQYNRRALEYLVNRKYPRQSLWPTSNKRPSFFPMTNL